MQKLEEAEGLGDDLTSAWVAEKGGSWQVESGDRKLLSPCTGQGGLVFPGLRWSLFAPCIRLAAAQQLSVWCILLWNS